VKTDAERRLSIALGIPFLVLLAAIPFASTLALKTQHQPEISLAQLAIHAFEVGFTLVLDWLLFCTITPALVVIPGSEGAEGYKEYAFHFRGFLIGTALSAVAGVVIGVLTWITWRSSGCYLSSMFERRLGSPVHPWPRLIAQHPFGNPSGRDADYPIGVLGALCERRRHSRPPSQR
jgi:hypothetical protein